jgi:hypothetical protein
MRFAAKTRRFAGRSLLKRLLSRVQDSLIHGGAALVFDHGMPGPEALNHGDKDDVACGIDPEPAAGGAIPEECCADIGKIGELRIVFDGAVVAAARSHVVGSKNNTDFGRMSACVC